ncbi:MAG: RlmE family RNA methyltransferase [Phycisphaeraceae bacterium]|nr:RlmE family RNA methyltransferase [Phycisphaeraceae bacterium]
MPQRRELHDAYFRKAKAEGYLARSAYKLKQLDEKRRLLRAGDRVLDLGCAPGSWLQVAGQAVGPRGRVVGIDLQPVQPGLGPNVTTLVADVFAADAESLCAMAGGRFNVVLSDMAPNTTGAGDHFRSVALCRRVLELLPSLLAPGGHLAMKVFEGEQYPALLKETALSFDECKGFKPDATRDVSPEMYIVAKRYRPALTPPPAPVSAPAAAPAPGAPAPRKARP